MGVSKVLELSWKKCWIH